jgi:Trypsin-like peptidase domain
MRIWVATLAVVLPLAGCGAHLVSAPTVLKAPVLERGVPAIAAAEVGPDPRVGAVFLGAGTLHTCSGAVLDSPAGDLVLTAAHCLAQGVPTTFVPAFKNEAAADDVWKIDTVYLDPRWVATQDPMADYAIARVSHDGGGSIEAQAGAGLTLGVAPTAGTPVTVTGYPVGEGGTPLSCQAATSMTPGGYPTLRCGGLVDGTSGGPWISGSTVTGVVGGLNGGGCYENISYTSPFDADTARLLVRAEAGGPGDPAPNTYNSQC